MKNLGLREHDTRLHVFSLADFHQAVNGKWERLAGLVEIATEQIIRRHIDPAKDFYTRLDPETPCLVLPRTERKEAHMRVAAIAHDLTVYLFGEGTVGGRRPQVTSANLGIDEVGLAADQSVSERVREALAEAVPMATSEETSVKLGEAHRQTLTSLLGETSAANIYAITGQPTTPGEVPVWVKIQAPPKRAEEPGWVDMPTSPRQAQESQWLERNLDERAAASLATERHLTSSSALTLMWTPTWVTNTSAIGAFHARVIRRDSKDTPPLEGVHAYAGASPIEALILDRFVATQAAQELHTISMGRHRKGLTVPLHWTSLAPRWHDCILMPFEVCPPQDRRKLLKLEIFGLTPAIPPEVLARLFQPLERIGCDFIVRLPLSSPEMIYSMGLASAVGVDLAELEEDARVGDDQLFEQLKRLHDEARKAHLASYVWGVRRRALIARLVRAGFSLVNGPGVTNDISHPSAFEFKT
jgi:hypothetical protein